MAHPKRERESATRALTNLIRDADERAVDSVPLPRADDLEELWEPDPDPTGRSKYTWANAKLMLEAIARGMPAHWAARRVGIDRRTYYRWINTKPNFAAMVEEMEARRIDYLTNLIMVAAPDNWAAAMTLLERLHPQDFGRKDRIEHHYTGEVNIDVRKVLVSDEAINAASAFERALQEGNATKAIEGEIVRELPAHEEES